MDEDIGLGEVIESFIDYSMQNRFTALPGVVLRVHNKGAQQLIDVQPCVSIKNRDDTVTQQATILNVPYQQPASSLGGVVFPLNVGDNVLLVFQMRGIDTWKYGEGGLSAPSDYRMFSNQDCIAIPCISPTSKTQTAANKHSGDYSLGDTILYNSKDTEVILKQSGKVVVNCKNAEINASDSTTINTKDFKINCDSYLVSSGSYQISTGSYALAAGAGGATTSGTMVMSGSFVLNGITLESHTHGGVTTGSGNTGGPH